MVENIQDSQNNFYIFLNPENSWKSEKRDNLKNQHEKLNNYWKFDWFTILTKEFTNDNLKIYSEDKKQRFLLDKLNTNRDY